MGRNTPNSTGRAQTETIGFVLIIGFVVLGSLLVVGLGAVAIGDTEEQLTDDRAEQALTQFDSKAALVALGGSDSHAASFGQGVTDSSQLTVEDDRGWLRVTVTNQTDGTTTELVNVTELGAIVYEGNDVQLAYQGGGVWRTDSQGGAMVAPPEFHYRDGTLTLPVINISGETLLDSEVSIEHDRTIQKFPNASGFSNPLTDSVVTVTISSTFYRGWADFVADRTDGEVVMDAHNETVSLTLASPHGNVTAGSVIPGEASGGTLRFQGSPQHPCHSGGSKPPYVDSYNSTDGSYCGQYDPDEVTSAGDLRFRGDIHTESAAGRIQGDFVSGEAVMLHGNAPIHGNVSYVGTCEITRGAGSNCSDAQASDAYSVQQRQSVQPSPRIDFGIENTAEAVYRSGSQVAIGEDAGETSTLAAGEYYTDSLTLADAEEATFNTSTGDITLVVNDTIELVDEANLTVVGDNEVNVYVNGAGPGVDELFVQNSDVFAPDNDATKLTVFGVSDFTATIVNGTYTGVIYAPSGLDGNGAVDVFGHLFGGVTTGDLTVGTATGGGTGGGGGGGSGGGSGGSGNVTAKAVFTQGNKLVTTGTTGNSTTEWGINGVRALGPMAADFDGDGAADIPYLTDASSLKLIDENDGSPRETEIGGAPADTQKTALSVDSWNGSPTSVFYAGQGHSTLYRVVPGGNPVAVASPGNGVNVVLGSGDIDGDGTAELAFADGSQTIRYLEPNGSIHSTGQTAGSSNNIGAARPVDLDGDGTATVPIVDGSNQILLVDADGIDETIITGSDDEQAAKSHIAVADIDGDGESEIVYLENNDSPADLRYVDDVGGSNTFESVYDDSGDRIPGDKKRGVLPRIPTSSSSPYGTDSAQSQGQAGGYGDSPNTGWTTSGVGASADTVSGVVFTQSGGDLRTLGSDGEQVADWGIGGVRALGPKTVDFDGDGATDIPYLADASSLMLVDGNDGSPRETDIGTAQADTQKTALSVGSWDGSPTSVFYAGQGHSTIYRVVPGGNPVAVASPGNGVNVVLGPGDIDGDGTDELAFADGSQMIRYLESDGSIDSTGQIVGASNNIGVGRPVDFDGDGTATVPVVNKTNKILLVDAAGTEESIISSSTDEQSTKSHITAADIDGDGTLEIVYLENNDSPADLRYVDDVRGSNSFESVYDASGDRIPGDKKRGVLPGGTSGGGGGGGGNVSDGAGGTIHYDRALQGQRILPQKLRRVMITFLHLTENRITVTD